MPTVKLPNGTIRVFPYNAVGKAQAVAYSIFIVRNKKNNPGAMMEKTPKSGY